MKENSSGFTVIIIILLVIALIGSVGYIIYNNNRFKDDGVLKQLPSPTQIETPLPTTDTTPLPTTDPNIIINYKQKPDWNTYQDSVAKFSIQYPENYKLGEDIQEGKNAYFLSCGHKNPETDINDLCTSGFQIVIYSDYDQGSRRVWLNSKFDIYKPHYSDLIISSKKALVTIEGNPAGSSTMFVSIPNGNQMIVFTLSFVSWDPDTGELPNIDYFKDILSTFKYIE